MKATRGAIANMGKEIQLMEQLERDNEWFKSEFDELQEKYQKKFVAIKNEKILESRSNFQELIENLERKKENPAVILIKFIHEKGTSVII